MCVWQIGGRMGRVQGWTWLRSTELGAVQPNLYALCGGGVDRLWMDQTVANAFGQSPGQIAEAAEELLDVGAEQIAAFDELQDHVRDLQQHVVVFDLSFAHTVGMFQIEPAVLLDIESFVLDFPSTSTAAVTQGYDVLRPDREVGQPGEELRVPSVLFAALHRAEPLSAVLVVHVLKVFHPGKALVDARIGGVAPSVLWAEFQQGLVFLPDRRHGALLEGDEVLPVVLSADRQNRPVGVQAVQTHAHPQLGAVHLEPHLPSRTELQQEQHQPFDQQELPVIDAQLLNARVGHLPQP